MSPPSFPPGWFTPESGDAVPPVEKERRWWTPIAAAIDRWLEPRWRALLTWAVVTSATAWILDRFMWFYDAFSVGFQFVLPYLRNVPFPWGRIPELGYVSSVLVLLFWIQPVALRLGLARTALWLAATVGLGMLALFAPSRWPEALIHGQFLGLPGLATWGRRTRPWISLHAGLLAIAVGLLPNSFLGSTAWQLSLFVASSVLYGAVMLYGTAPLARKEGAR